MTGIIPIPCWEMTSFTPLPLCNTYSLHVLSAASDGDRECTMAIDISGRVHCLLNNNKGGEKVVIDLRGLVKSKESSGKEDDDEFSLELVASDISLIGGGGGGEKGDDLAYLATCWVVYDRLCAPESHFAAFFKISSTFKAELWNKFDVPNAPTYTRLTKTSPMDTNHLYWLIFSYNRNVQAFDIKPSLCSTSPIESIGDVFPVLDIGSCPGSAIRSHCWIAQDYRFSVVGYDTGYVIASVCTMQEGTIIDRKTIKFGGPISVLRLINEDEERLSSEVLVSSTLGPAAIWALKLEVGWGRR